MDDALPVPIGEAEVWRHPCATKEMPVLNWNSFRRALGEQLNASIATVAALKRRFAGQVSNLLSNVTNSFSLDNVSLIGRLEVGPSPTGQESSINNVLDRLAAFTTKLMQAYIFLEQSRYDESIYENMAHEDLYTSLMEWCGQDSLLNVLCSLVSFLETNHRTITCYPTRNIMNQTIRQVTRENMHKRDYVIVKDVHDILVNMTSI